MNRHILTFVFFLTLKLSFGQVDQASNFADLYATWHLKDNHQTNDSILTFERKNYSGRVIKINQTGDFVDSYVALCGNDSRGHNTSGKWQIDPASKTLTTTITLADNGQKFKIVSVTNNELVLQKIK